jgi:hypothetical protein
MVSDPQKADLAQILAVFRLFQNPLKISVLVPSRWKSQERVPNMQHFRARKYLHIPEKTKLSHKDDD